MSTMKLIGIYTVVYVIMVFGASLSEITYKHRPPKEVLADLHTIMLKCLLGLLVMIVALTLHRKFGLSP